MAKTIGPGLRKQIEEAKAGMTKAMARPQPARRGGPYASVPTAPARPIPQARDTSRRFQLGDGFEVTADELTALVKSVVRLQLGPALTAADLPALSGLIKFLTKVRLAERGIR